MEKYDTCSNLKNSASLFEEQYWSQFDECAICQKLFPKAQNEKEGEYHFVLFESNKNPNMKWGIYRADKLPFHIPSIEEADCEIIFSAVTWIATVPPICYNLGKICQECIKKYCRS